MHLCEQLIRYLVCSEGWISFTLNFQAHTLLSLFVMAFYNVETIQPNFFLLNGPLDTDVRDHSRQCFCVNCRALEIAEVNGRYVPIVDDRRKIDELRRMMCSVLPNQLSGAQDKVFATTKKQIIHGKLYHQTALSSGDYVLFKCWAKVQPFYQEFINGGAQVKKEFDKHCKLVVDCAYVYDHWDIIVNNLTNESMTNINARNFSVGKFREAINFNWCIENERARGAAPGRRGEQLWTKDDVNDTALHVLGVARLDEADRYQTSRFCQAVERRCLAIVKARRQEEDNIDG